MYGVNKENKEDSTDKTSFIIGFTFGEARLLKQYLIKALNDNEMPLPEFYKDMLGINKWQEGLPIYYQKLPEKVSELPAELDEQTAALIEQYS